MTNVLDEVRFHNLSFLARPGRVMTPRPATEQLVARALRLIGDRPARVADVGTGSGAIAVTLALLAPQAEVWATDVDENALELAAANAGRWGIGDRVHVVHGDLLEPIHGPLDLVVANLPYLPEELRGAPGYEDLEAEPSAAVFAPGDGLDPYRRLLAASESRLEPDGTALVQLRGRMLEARRDELRDLSGRLTDLARAAA